MIEDLKGDESWRMFRIISEFTGGFEELADIGFAVTLFGSARTKPDDPDYQAADAIAGQLAKEEWLGCLDKLCTPHSKFLEN